LSISVHTLMIGALDDLSHSISYPFLSKPLITNILLEKENNNYSYKPFPKFKCLTSIIPPPSLHPSLYFSLSLLQVLLFFPITSHFPITNKVLCYPTPKTPWNHISNPLFMVAWVGEFLDLPFINGGCGARLARLLQERCQQILQERNV